MYKDKDKQQEQSRRRQQRYRDGQKRNATVTQKRNVTVGNVTRNEKALPLAPGQYKVGATVESIMPDDYEEPKKQSYNPMIVTGNAPGEMQENLPANFGLTDCECRHCQNNRATPGNRKVINHGPVKVAGELASNELNRVALPGDVDYVTDNGR